MKRDEKANCASRIIHPLEVSVYVKPVGVRILEGSQVHEVGEVDVGVVAQTTLSRWIPNLTGRLTLDRIQ